MRKIEIIEKYVEEHLQLINKTLTTKNKTEEDIKFEEGLQTTQFILRLILDTIKNVKNLDI